MNSLAISLKRVQIFERKLNICLSKQLSVPERAGVTSLEGKNPQAKDSRVQRKPRIV